MGERRGGMETKVKEGRFRSERVNTCVACGREVEKVRSEAGTEKQRKLPGIPHVPLSWNLPFCVNHFPCLQTEGPPNLFLKIMVRKCWWGWGERSSWALVVGLCVVTHAREK